MAFTFQPMQREHAQAVLSWRYEPPYDFYNMNDDDIAYMTDPANQFYAMLDARSGHLVGYCCLGAEGRVTGYDYTEAALDVGIGIHPELTGKGNGHLYGMAVVRFAQADGRPLRVAVAAFNTRSQRLCEGLGFQEVARFHRPSDQVEFIILERKHHAKEV